MQAIRRLIRRETSGYQPKLKPGGNIAIADDGTISATAVSTAELNTAVATRQATIDDRDLTIARTTGLQAALDSKQATIGDGDLPIARTSGLQAALDAKQATLSSSNRLNANLIGGGSVGTNEFNTLNNSDTSTTLQVQIDAPQAHACSLRKSNNQSIPSNQSTQLVFNQNRINTGIYCVADNAINNITITRAGIYSMSGTLVCSTGQRVIYNLKKNGSFMNINDGGKPIDVDEGTSRALSWDGLYSFAANDVIMFFIHIITGSDDVQGIVNCFYAGDA